MPAREVRDDERREDPVVRVLRRGGGGGAQGTGGRREESLRAFRGDLERGRLSELSGIKDAKGSVFGVHGGVDCKDVWRLLLLLPLPLFLLLLLLY